MGGNARAERVPRGRTPARGSVFDPRYEVGPTGERVASPDAARPGRRLVHAAAWLDLAFAVAVVLQAIWGDSHYGRFFARFLIAAGAWVVLAFQCGGMHPLALKIRRTVGVAGLGLAALRLVLSGPFEAEAAPWIAAACGVFAVGSLACHRALRLRAREVCDSHPTWEDCAPKPSPWTGRRVAVVVSSLQWMACGATETWVGNLWFGQVIVAAGVLGLLLAKDLSRPGGGRSLAFARRPGLSPWLIYPAGTPLLLLRVAWLLLPR